MKKTTNIALLLAFMVFGFCLNSQAISLTVGTGDYYVNVGDHDYLPYAYQGYGGGSQFPALSFQTAMGGYGTWASMQPFGQVFRPYVANDWRPYTNGHWVYTQYGPTWQGYEPFSWATSHYGNWVFSQQMGWVWIPGYEYHGGRVAWSQGYNSIGWMPMPPSGYDYSRGYLSRVGPQNQFTYMDDDFSIGFGIGGGSDYYGGPYYDPRYRNMYYNSSYLNIAGLLWTFLDPNHFTSDNYADYYYGGDYARMLFDRRLVRISTQPIDRVVLERVVRTQIPVRQVRTNQIRIDGREVRIAAIEGEEERIRRHANRTVREVIAPAFAEKGKTFKGEKAQNRERLTRAFKMENAPRRVETVTTEEIVRESRQKRAQREQRREQVKTRKQQEVTQVEKQGKIKERKDRAVRETGTEDNRSRSTRTTPAETPRNRPAEAQTESERRNERAVEAQQKKEQQEQQRRNRRPTTEQEEQEKRRNRPTTEEDQPVEDEQDVRTRDRRSTPQPDSDPNIQTDIDRERKEREEAEVRSNEDQPERKAKTKKTKAQIEKERKAKSKKAAEDKEKDKKQNQDDEPPQE